jgi:glycosyltransferase involved in cell wall biosynthesis
MKGNSRARGQREVWGGRAEEPREFQGKAIHTDSAVLAGVFQAAEAHPMASLEAAAAGANLVMSNLPNLRELFGDYAWYCNPRSVGSIRKAVLEAWEAPRGARYVSPPPWLISWEEVARRLVGVYEDVLRNGSSRRAR